MPKEADRTYQVDSHGRNLFWIFRSPKISFFAVATLGLWVSGSRPALAIDDLGPAASEQQEVDQRLSDFYQSPFDAAVMNRIPPKFREGSELLRRRHQSPRESGSADSLQAAAGLKTTLAFRRWRCAKIHGIFNPDSGCTLSADKEQRNGDDDNYKDLINGWVKARDAVNSLDDVPLSSEASRKPWSDDYWATQYGGLSYRYSSGLDFDTYEAAIAAYKQPDDWQKVKSEPQPKTIDTTIAAWSPAEKYDLATADDQFALTLEQKGEGQDLMVNHKVLDWYGICDGWAAASIMVPRPQKPVDTIGLAGHKVHWYPSDVRAITSLAWAKSDYDSNTVGGRCDTAKPQTYPNGRLKQPECFDTNPATLTLALANMLGVKHQAFIMDIAFDAEIWNQPVVAYQLQYFNPLDPKQKSDQWRDVMVPYDDTFKAVDRFQDPLTRGHRDRHGNYDDAGIKDIVGVIATITYEDDADPDTTDEAPKDSVVKVSYTYDLELYRRSGDLVPLGGEWHENAHPDFIWIPRRGVRLDLPQAPERIDLSSEASAGTTAAARDAAADGKPLCDIVEALADVSSEQPANLCR